VEAEGLFKVLARRHPDSPWGHRGLGDLLVESSPSRALGHYARARELDATGTIPGFDYLRGVAALREGDAIQAQRWLQRAVAMEPDNARYWCDLGACSFHSGDLDEALTATERALRLDPGHPGFLHNLSTYLEARFRRNPWRHWSAGWRAWRLRRRVGRSRSEGWRRDLWSPPEEAERLPESARAEPPRDA
jgi:tetratricopeptide (TPR) repeat protein